MFVELQVSVQSIDNGKSSWQVQFHDVRETLHMLDDASKVSAWDTIRTLSSLGLGDNFFSSEGRCSGGSAHQGLTGGELVLSKVCIPY